MALISAKYYNPDSDVALVTNFGRWNIPEEFLSIFDEIRIHGYACDKEEFEVGLTCYAVPILDVFGRPIAAISSSGPTTRMVNNQEQYIKSLTAILQKIQQKLI